jgi:hypothetical protein
VTAIVLFRDIVPSPDTLISAPRERQANDNSADANDDNLGARNWSAILIFSALLTVASLLVVSPFISVFGRLYV